MKIRTAAMCRPSRLTSTAILAATIASQGLLVSAASAEPPPPQNKSSPHASRPAPPKPAAKVPLPDTPLKRASKLRDLHARLATSESEEAAAKISAEIERLWLTPSSDTVGVLMDRASRAANEDRYDLALNLLQTATELAPDYAEVWNRRAYIHYKSGDLVRAMGDLRRTLALDPNHFKALEGLGQILKELGYKQSALAVFRQLQFVHPYRSGTQQAIDELAREVDGRTL